MKNIFTIKGVIKEAQVIMKPQLWKVIRQYTAIIAIFMLMSLMGGDNMLLSILISSLVAFTTALYSLGYAKNGTYSLKEFMGALSFQSFAYFFLAFIVSRIFIFAGFVVLIIPGIILSVWFAFVKFVAVEKEVGPWEACKESIRLTSGNRWKLLGFFVVAFFFNVLGLICLGVGVFYTAPVTFIATALIYRKLYEAKDFTPEIIEVIETEIDIVEEPELAA